jgi:hypothetical protein
MARTEQWLQRFGAGVVGIISPLVIWCVWGQIDPLPGIHDEASYVLQAEIFASGRWTAPSPPIPEFFEQPHVQVVPALASKYPPGHALLLSLGAAIGFTALVPLLLTGCTAALLYALVKRVTTPWVALVAWPAWLFAPMVLRFQPTYMSELTTTLLVLGSWWALLSWRASRRPGWLLALALMVGWGAITRPLTMLVFAIPIGLVVIRDVVRDRRWGHLGLACLLGAAVLSILPVWSVKTTGSWQESPVEKYRLDYLPFDKIGFRPDSTPPRRAAAMTRVLNETYWQFMAARTRQSFQALPNTIMRRATAILRGLFDGVRLPLLVIAIAGLFHATPPLRFALGSALLLVAAHLPYAHFADWTVYYLEIVPVAAGFIGVGAWHLAGRLREARRQMVAMAMAALIALAGIPEALYWRHAYQVDSALERQITGTIPRLPTPGIIFVRYSPQIANNPAIVWNSAHLDDQPIWIVHDLGPMNAELLRVDPQRTARVLDISTLLRARPSP